MRYKNLRCAFLLSILFNGVLPAQTSSPVNPELLHQQWAAHWITVPEIQGDEYGVYLFRKSVEIAEAPKVFWVHLSADNRYKFFVNGQYVCNGPARSDLLHWQFETVDIAPFLKPGKNMLAAIVWNFGADRPVAQFSEKTGFILQSDTETGQSVNTNASWEVMKDAAYSPIPVQLQTYYVVGPGEQFDGTKHPWNWMQGTSETAWPAAKELERGTPLHSQREYGSPARHILVPRDIPPMEERVQQFGSIRRSSLPGIPEGFVSGKAALKIPAQSQVKILLDQGYLTNAYPVLQYAGGKGAAIKITYAESLFDAKGAKGNRNEIAGKEIKGTHDLVLADGGSNRHFQTLWWRTFRYVQLDISTGNTPLDLLDFHSIFTGYPLEEKAHFQSENPFSEAIWTTGWRTQRLCAGETFFDCPYYEQLQYAGDTRIQSLVSTYVSGDTVLMRSALLDLRDSRLPIGLTQSRYPSYQPQIIPTFSLVWITMLHDYWMLCDDKKLVREMLPGVLEVLQWYEQHLDETGLLRGMEWWNFVDWVEAPGWKSGAPPGAIDGHSAMISLQYAYTIRKAADLLRQSQYREQASHYVQLAEHIKASVYTRCYDHSRGLLADTPDKQQFSQHTNLLALLTDAAPKEQQTAIMEKILSEKDLSHCTYYFQFYLVEALAKTGMGDRYAETLDPWISMLGKGLSTFAEKPDPTRSDCHAWSASPLYYFLSLVCGIQPAEPGFQSVRIAPHPRKYGAINGSMPHRQGTISVQLKADEQGKIFGEIILPGSLGGEFLWRGERHVLTSGVNKIDGW